MSSSPQGSGERGPPKTLRIKVPDRLMPSGMTESGQNHPFTGFTRIADLLPSPPGGGRGVGGEGGVSAKARCCPRRKAPLPALKNCGRKPSPPTPLPWGEGSGGAW